MKLYVQPLFSDNHSTGSIIKKLGSSDYTFSSIRILYKEKALMRAEKFDVYSVVNQKTNKLLEGLVDKS